MLTRPFRVLNLKRDHLTHPFRQNEVDEIVHAKELDYLVAVSPQVQTPATLIEDEQTSRTWSAQEDFVTVD